MKFKVNDRVKDAIKPHPIFGFGVIVEVNSKRHLPYKVKWESPANFTQWEYEKHLKLAENGLQRAIKKAIEKAKS